MARGVNKVILIGHLGNDPDVRSTATGLTVANIRLATNHSVKNRETGEWQEATEWHTVVFFDRIAEVVKQYLRKGSPIYVEGRLQTRKWQDQTGQDRYTTEIIANEMQMLGSRSDSTGYRGEAPTSYAAPVASNPTNYAAPVVSSRPQASPSYAEEPNLPPLPPDLPPADTGATGQRWGGSPPPSKNFDDDVPF